MCFRHSVKKTLCCWVFRYECSGFYANSAYVPTLIYLLILKDKLHGFSSGWFENFPPELSVLVEETCIHHHKTFFGRRELAYADVCAFVHMNI